MKADAGPASKVFGEKNMVQDPKKATAPNSWSPLRQYLVKVSSGYRQEFHCCPILTIAKANPQPLGNHWTFPRRLRKDSAQLWRQQKQMDCAMSHPGCPGREICCLWREHGMGKMSWGVYRSITALNVVEERWSKTGIEMLLLTLFCLTSLISSINAGFSSQRFMFRNDQQSGTASSPTGYKRIGKWKRPEHIPCTWWHIRTACTTAWYWTLPLMLPKQGFYPACLWETVYGPASPQTASALLGRVQVWRGYSAARGFGRDQVA